VKSAEYRRGYDAGYKQALLDALDRNRAVGEALQERRLAPRHHPARIRFDGPLP
jgi:hypothetical protein